MGSPEIMAAWDEMCLKCAEHDAMVDQRDEALQLAAQLRDDYSWLLVQIDLYGSQWDEPRIIDNDLTTRGGAIMGMARNRYRYQREDNAEAYDAMRARHAAGEAGE